MRWALVLSCSHTLLADDAVLVGDNEYCPGCGATYQVIEVYKHRDEDV